MSSETSLGSVKKLCPSCKASRLCDPDAYTSNPHSLRSTGESSPHRQEYEIDLNWSLESSLKDADSLLSRRECDLCYFLSRPMGRLSSALAKELEARCGQDEGNTQHRDTLPFVMKLFYLFTGAHSFVRQLAALRIRLLIDGKSDIVVDCPISGVDEEEFDLTPPLRSPLTHLEEDKIHWMKTMIDSCSLHGHVRSQEGYLPDRLIKVRDDYIQLVLTKDASPSRLPESYRYAALTYCWGPPPFCDQQLKTTTVNIAQHQQRIPEHLLPKTIMDTVSVARALSIPFLWIDALCIIQDDPDDWNQQCVLMEKIYNSSCVTLAAAVPDTCEAGYVSRMDRVLLPIPGRSGPSARSLAIYRPSSRENSTEEIAASTWVSRGWTHQERLTSNCIIWFGRSNIHFQCATEDVSMGGSGGSTAGFVFNMLDYGLLNTGSKEALYTAWLKDIVSDFTCYMFNYTRDTDVLPSMAGVASMFSSQLEDEYLAGLWRNDLNRSLCWTTWSLDSRDIDWESLLSGLEKPSPYLAPSWSWARSSVLVTFDIYRLTYDLYFREECTILNARTVLKGVNPFGEVTGGVIEIHGKVYYPSQPWDYRIVRDYGGEQKTIFVDDEYFAAIETDCEGESFVRANNEGDARVGFLLMGSTVTIGRLERRAKLDYPAGAEGGMTEEERADILGRPRMAYGLLICPTGQPDQYYRVGMFRSEGHELGGLQLFADCETRTVKII